MEPTYTGRGQFPHQGSGILHFWLRLRTVFKTDVTRGALMRQEFKGSILADAGSKAVSYTHLTLPTN